MTKSITLAEAADVFLNRYRKKMTRRAYDQDLRHLMQFIAPATPIASITGYDLERAFGGVVNLEGINSVHTLNKFVKSMRTFFNWAQKKGLIENAGALRLEYLPVPENDVLERTMSNEDYHNLVKFYTALAAVKPRYYRPLALILFLGDTGTRREGLARLRWSDIDFSNSRAITTEKGDKTHRRTFGHIAASALKQWRLIQKVRQDISQEAIYIFSHDGHRMTGPALAQYFRRRCTEAGIGSWGPHSVRHNLGFRLQDAKVPDNLAAAVMGHSVDTYRKHYASTDDERVRKAALEVAYTHSDLPTKIPEKIKPFRASGDNP